MATALRRSREIVRTREEILDAAERAFARAGYEATTMQDIAREAAYTVPSLYAYFPGKHEIFEGLMTRTQEELLAGFDEPIPKGLPLAQRLELLVVRRLELYERRREALSILFMMPAPARVGRIRERKKRGEPTGFERASTRMATWLTEHATAKELGGRDVEAIATALTGMLYAFFRRSLEGPHRPLTERAEQIVDLVLHGVVGRRP
jgi:AcrR family transcriptional regulator